MSPTVTPNDLASRDPTEVLRMIEGNDPSLRCWTAGHWYALADGANSAGGSRKSPAWHRVAVRAAMRSRGDSHNLSRAEVSSRLALLFLAEPIPGDVCTDPEVLWSWCRMQLDGWSKETLWYAVREPWNHDPAHARNARRAAQALDTLKEIVSLILVPADLEPWIQVAR